MDSGARASSTLSGDLGSRPLAVLLAGACERKTSGTFTFRNGRRIDLLTLRRGQVAVVRTHDPVFYLGGILLEQGVIDLHTLQRTVKDLSTVERLHGEILVSAKAITQTQLDAALAEQTYKKTAHLFALPDTTTWSFREDVDELTGERDEDRPPIDTWRAIWRGLRGIIPSAHVKRTLAKIDAGLRLKDASMLDQFALEPEERDLCQRLHGRASTLAEILRTTTLGQDRTEMLLYLLALARCVTRVEAPPIGPVELGIEGVRVRAQAIANEDPRTALGVRVGMSPEATRATYFRLARLWHPERIPSALAEVRAECNFVFNKLAEAHRILGEEAAAERKASMPPDSAASFFSMRPSGALSMAPPSSAGAEESGGRITMKDVDAALARGDLDAADTLSHALSHGGADGPTARAVMAWCAAGAGHGSVSLLERGLVALDRLLHGDPECVRGLYYRAQLEMRLGLTDAALRDYRKVVRLDPRHMDAQREVRLMEISGKPLRSVTPPRLVASASATANSGARAPLEQMTMRESATLPKPR